MGRTLLWIALAVYAISWFVDVHVGLQADGPEARVIDAFRDFGARLERGLAREGVPTRSGDAEALGDRLPSASGPPGWRALRFAWDLLRGEEGASAQASEKKRVLLGLTSLTNGVMLLTALVLFLSLRAVPRALGLLLLACAGLNLGWVYLTESEFREGLRLGYWLWVGSFALAGVGALRGGSD